MSEKRVKLTKAQREACKSDLRTHWHDFCDADPVPSDFIDNMERAGLVRIRPVRKVDVEDDSFAAERGIELGGWLWELTSKGRAALETNHV